MTWREHSCPVWIEIIDLSMCLIALSNNNNSCHNKLTRHWQGKKKQQNKKSLNKKKFRENIGFLTTHACKLRKVWIKPTVLVHHYFSSP